MKTKNGKLKLGKDDIQIGNFVISKENMHYKLQDINGYWSMRIAFMHPMYTMIEECLKAKNMDYLHSFAAIMYAIGSTPADAQMLADLHRAYFSLMERMKDNGIFKDMTDEENLQQTKTSYQTKEQLKKIVNDKPDTDTQGQPA